MRFWTWDPVWTLNLVGSALVVWRLYSLELHKIYRYFFAGMMVTLLRSAILFPFFPTERTYYQIWITTGPLIWLACILVVFELYTLVLKQYRGIYSLSRRFFLGAWGISLLISTLTVLPAIEVTSSAAGALNRPPLLAFYALIERGIDTSLAVLLLLLMAFAAVCAVPLSRNLLVHASVYTIYFLASNISVFFWSVSSGNDAWFWNRTRLCVAVGCYIAWAIFLGRCGEVRIGLPTPDLPIMAK